jgi:signal peptidase I
MFFLKPLLTFLFFPYFYIKLNLRKNNKIFSQIVSTYLASFFLVTWKSVYYLSFYNIKKTLGLVSVPVSIAGTGSMYPTFPKSILTNPIDQAKDSVAEPKMYPYPNGLVLNNKNYFGFGLNRGDIVVVENEAIDELSTKTYGDSSAWVKRLIGLPGESIELRGGIVYLNDSPLKEPYTAKSHSTFGEKFLKECEKLLIPYDSVFVMGDNRKASADSREIGFIKLADISYVIPYTKQIGVLDRNYRDTLSDLDDSHKLKIITDEYLKLLNSKRAELGLNILEYQPKLEKTASLRGKVILEYDDSSYEATKSGYTQDDAFNDVGYFNIVYGESLVFGFYESDELIENQFEFPETSKFLLNPEFEEFGIAQVEGELNGCPSQVIVSHFAGYKPPNYTAEELNSWKNSLKNLNDIIPGWEKARDYDFVNPIDLETLLALLYRQRDIASLISIKMENNQWLSDKEEKMIAEYEKIVPEASALANKINNR